MRPTDMMPTDMMRTDMTNSDWTHTDNLYRYCTKCSQSFDTRKITAPLVTKLHFLNSMLSFHLTLPYKDILIVFQVTSAHLQQYPVINITYNHEDILHTNTVGLIHTVRRQDDLIGSSVVGEHVCIYRGWFSQGKLLTCWRALVMDLPLESISYGILSKSQSISFKHFGGILKSLYPFLKFCSIPAKERTQKLIEKWH